MKKIVFLVDMNAFFISCETTRNPGLKGKPAAVAGDPERRSGIILAANYEARAFGVRTTMVIHQALRLCPELILVPPDHRFYEEKSMEVMDILSGFTPVIEQNSIDEAWLDMTGTEALFGNPMSAASSIMKKINNQLGLMCSIGISENKFLSKMASDLKKPMGITEIWKKDLPSKLWPLPVKAMYGVGVRTAEKLNSIGIHTIGRLAKSDLNLIIKLFGKNGVEMHNHANGIDDAPVCPQNTENIKSIGRSKTLPEDITDPEKAKIILLELADDIGMKTRMHCKKGSKIQLTLKFSDFKEITRQATIFPTDITKEIFEAGLKLLYENWNNSKPVRLIGLSISGFDRRPTIQMNQLSLFEDLDMGMNIREKNEKVDKTVDKLRKQFGTEIIKPGPLIKKDI